MLVHMYSVSQKTTPDVFSCSLTSVHILTIMTKYFLEIRQQKVSLLAHLTRLINISAVLCKTQKEGNWILILCAVTILCQTSPVLAQFPDFYVYHFSHRLLKSSNVCSSYSWKRCFLRQCINCLHYGAKSRGSWSLSVAVVCTRS